MERLRGHINSCYLGEHLDVERFEQGFMNPSLRVEVEDEEEDSQYSTASLEDTMPFLQMLQSVETPSFLHFKEPNFQTLLKLQHFKKPWDMDTFKPQTEPQVQALELESCVTHENVDMYSPAKSATKGLQNPHSNYSSCIEYTTSEPKEEPPNSIEFELPYCREGNSDSSIPRTHAQNVINKEIHLSKTSATVAKERRKRKRARPGKNKEEAESQRMTHIAAERNRRRQMNDHLNTLRSLMPPSYLQRGDQASIVGGAIDLVKELEQLLQSLEAKKRTRKAEDVAAAVGISSEVLFPSPSPPCDMQREDDGECEENNAKAKQKLAAAAAEIEVTAIQNHVNLKVRCERRLGQLLSAVVALEDLRLTVLHLNITSSHTTVLYTFNLKIEDDCKVGSADEVAAAVHKIFNTISCSCGVPLGDAATY